MLHLREDSHLIEFIQNPTLEINTQGVSRERSPDKKLLLLRDIIYRMIENCFSDNNNSGDSGFRKSILNKKRIHSHSIDRLMIDECTYTIPCGDNDVSCTDSFNCQDKAQPGFCIDSSIYCHDTQCAHVAETCINIQCTDSDNCINSGAGTTLTGCEDSSCTDTGCINGRNNPTAGSSCIDNTNCADNEDCINDNGCWDNNCTNDECHNDDCNNTTSCSDVNCINDTSCTDTDNNCSYTDCINTDC